MTELGLKGTHVMCLYQLLRHKDGLTAAELSGLCLEEYVSLTKEEGRAITFTDAHGLSYNIAYADTLPDLDLMKDGVIVNPVAQEGSGYLVTSVTHNPIKTPLRWN